MLPVTGLTSLQREMLEAGRFHVDGWTSARGREAAAALERRGLVESFVGGDSQYTAINYRVTEAGRSALGGPKDGERCASTVFTG